MNDHKAFADRLRALSRRPNFNAQRDARAESLKPLVNVARGILEANGNRITGKYIGSLGIAAVDLRTSAAGPLKGRPHASLGVLLEFGTAPHYQPIRGQMHPGAQAFPHMRPAFDTTKGVVVATLGRAIVGSIFGSR